MIHVPTRDPFTVFGLEHELDVDERALERRYLELSRKCHPDLHSPGQTGDCVAVLQRAAEINDAWRVLRDPWQRARTLLELLSPGVLDRNKKLDPVFLAEALELAEEVAFVAGPGINALRARLQQALDADFADLRAAIARGDVDGAAKRVHASHYHRKALQDLEAKS